MTAEDDRRTFLGPFVHAVLLARVSTHAAALAVPRVLAASLEAPIDAARTEAARLAEDPSNTIEGSDESPAGREARRCLGLLRSLDVTARELALLRLVEGIGAIEIAQVFAVEPALLDGQLRAAVDAALQCLDPAAVSDPGAYVTEPQAATPIAALVAVENRLELLRFNEDAVPAAPLPMPEVPLPADPERTNTQLPKVEPTREVTATEPLPIPLPPSTRGPPEAAEKPSTDWKTDLTRLLEPVRERAPAPKARFPALWAAALFGAIAGTFAWSTLALAARNIQGGHRLIPVIVAASDLPVGTRLEPSMLVERWVPQDLATASIVTPGTAEVAVGRSLRFPLQAGDPVLFTHFSGAQLERLAPRLMHRFRALSLPVNRLSSLNGLLRPDDHIDVLVHLGGEGRKRGPVVTTMLENVKVIAVGLVSARTVIFPQGRDPEYAHVTVAVPFEHAELLALARTTASLSFSLRNAEDLSLGSFTSPVLLRELLDHAKTQQLQKRRMTTIQTIRESR